MIHIFLVLSIFANKLRIPREKHEHILALQTDVAPAKLPREWGTQVASLSSPYSNTVVNISWTKCISRQHVTWVSIVTALISSVCKVVKKRRPHCMSWLPPKKSMRKYTGLWGGERALFEPYLRRPRCRNRRRRSFPASCDLLLPKGNLLLRPFLPIWITVPVTRRNLLVWKVH